MRTRWPEILVHIVFWGCTAWLIAGSFSVQSQEIELLNGVETIKVVRSSGLIYQILYCILLASILFYFNAWLIIRLNKTTVSKRTFIYSLLAFAVALILAYLLSNCNLATKRLPLPRQIAFGIIIFYFAISVTYGLAKLWYLNQQRQQQILLDKKQTELTLLRNQLQPHFLFNALNNLLSMVDPSENPKLITSFEKLSHLLRYVIEETTAEKVSIQKEIDFLKNYIQLQLLRFNENEVTVEFNVAGNHYDQKVEPGLFIAFVENAFKYGVEPERTSTIEIKFNLEQPQKVFFEIKNPVMLSNNNGIGTGIETTKKRLRLIYPGKHELVMISDEEFTVTLNLTTA